MKVCIIGSGSRGNMTYVEAGETRLLIDAGISFPSAERRVPEIDFTGITDILITHEHTDHIRFLDTIWKRTGANIYLAKESFQALAPSMKEHLKGAPIAFLKKDCRYSIGEAEIFTLSFTHDCANTFGYIVAHKGKRFGTFTDTGIFPERYRYLLSELDCYLIEANHNIEMLQNSDRPASLITRILSSHGHLSNQSCRRVIGETISDRNKVIVLGHISEECNSLNAIREEIIDRITDFSGKILIASQEKATPVIEI